MRFTPLLEGNTPGTYERLAMKKIISKEKTRKNPLLILNCTLGNPA